MQRGRDNEGISRGYMDVETTRRYYEGVIEKTRRYYEGVIEKTRDYGEGVKGRPRLLGV